MRKIMRKTKVRHSGRTWWLDENGKMIAGSCKPVKQPSASTKVKKVDADFKRRFGAQDNADD